VKVLFWGTPDFAIPSLRALLGEGHDVVGVVTQPDRPAGRGRRLRASPVKEVALEEGLPVLTPERPRGEEFEGGASGPGARTLRRRSLRTHSSPPDPRNSNPGLGERARFSPTPPPRGSSGELGGDPRPHPDRHHHHGDVRGNGRRSHPSPARGPHRTGGFGHLPSTSGSPSWAPRPSSRRWP
jgi:hypothetical protein